MIQAINFSIPQQKHISFGHSIPGVKPPDYDLLQDFKRLRNISGLSCASCGTEMNTKKDIQNYIYVIANAADKPLINALTDSMHLMNPTAQADAKKVIILAEQNESVEIKDLMKMLAKGRKVPFLMKQNKKIEAKLKKFMQPKILYSLPYEVSSIITTTYDLAAKNNVKHSKTQENNGIAFIRNSVMQKLQYAANDHPKHKKIILAVRDEIRKLDSYFNSTDAFILACEKMSNKEIAELFFLAKSATVEHIVPRSEGGNNDHSNLLIFCKECNENRDCIDYKDMPYHNIAFIPSLRKYIFQVKEFIRTGKLPGFESYPQDVLKTLYNVSDGHIDIDV